jgi:hypothetical protein
MQPEISHLFTSTRRPLHSLDWNTTIWSGKGKGKAIPATGCGGPYGCETSRLSHFLRQSAHRWWWGCQPYAPAARPLPHKKFLVLGADDIGNTASSIVACWTVFTELLPGNALIKSVTEGTYRLHLQHRRISQAISNWSVIWKCTQLIRNNLICQRS